MGSVPCAGCVPFACQEETSMCRCEPMLVLGAEPCVSEQAVPHQLMKLLQQLELRAGPASLERLSRHPGLQLQAWLPWPPSWQPCQWALELALRQHEPQLRQPPAWQPCSMSAWQLVDRDSPTKLHPPPLGSRPWRRSTAHLVHGHLDATLSCSMQPGTARRLWICSHRRSKAVPQDTTCRGPPEKQPAPA